VSNLSGREHRLVDLSKVKDGRYRGAGIFVDAEKRARCSAQLCEWITYANTVYGGTSPFPYGVYILNGDAGALQDPPADLQEGPFLELLPCDRPDRRAARLVWNEAGTEAEFGFASLASVLGIDAPKGSTLWIEAIPVTDADGRPVMALPTGNRIKVQAEKESAAAHQAGEPAEGQA
jgi:hypothetical protein